jgi:signal transduction histidine kinase
VYQTGRPEISYEEADGKMLGARTTATQAYPLYDGAELTGHVWASVEARQLVPNTVAATMSVFGAAAASTVALLVAAWWLMNALGGWEREAATRRTTAANQLAAEVVHELRNPISVARGLAQLVMSEDDDLRRRMWLGNLVRQLDHMNTIASDYLRYARPAEPSLRSVPVGEILGELECVIRSSLDSTCVDFEVSQGPDPLEVMCDPDQLNQVLLNLAKNAVEAVSGEPRAQVCVRARPNGKTVLIDVCDSGPPIPDADLPRLFEPFFTTKPKGTGLGLAISKRLIERQGGSISARNTPGGATFTVSLPAGRDGAH